MTVPDWTKLRIEFPQSALDALREMFEGEGSFALTVETLTERSHADAAMVARLLERLAEIGALRRGTVVRCSGCERIVEPDEPPRDLCPGCGQAVADAGTDEETTYELERVPIRDVSWFFVLHGMNTTGTWQEELSFLIGKTYGHMVPLAIYKYGIVRPGVLFAWRRAQLVDEIAAKLRTLLDESAARPEVRDRPDMIAHSFGTLLIVETLCRHPDLKIGRLVLLGSIVRPDFDWKDLLDRKQVEAVLNHSAEKDGVVPLAEWFVPGSGPSGTLGFDSNLVTNVATKGLAHSGYFAPERLADLYASKWERFFVHAELAAVDLGPRLVPAQPWRALPRWMCIAARAMAIVLVVPLYLVVPNGVVEGISLLGERRSRSRIAGSTKGSR